MNLLLIFITLQSSQPHFIHLLQQNMVMMMFQLRPHIRILQYQYYHPSTTPKSAYNINNISKCRRREAAALSVSLSLLLFPLSSSSSSSSAVASTSASKSSSELLFLDIPNSGGVKVLDLRVGSGDVPLHGNQVHLCHFSLFLSFYNNTFLAWHNNIFL